MRNQPMISIGRVTSGGQGTQNVSVGGGSNPYTGVSSNSMRNTGEQVTVLFVDKDKPLVIGDCGYWRPE